MATICAMSPLERAQGDAGDVACRRARRAALQRAFRGGRRTGPAPCLPAEPRRRGVQAARRPIQAPAAARTGSSRNARPAQEFVIAGYVPSTDFVEGDRLAGARPVTKARSLFMPAGSAPASRARSPKISTSGWKSSRRDDSPFAGRLSADARRQVRFVEPQLVAEVEFRALDGGRDGAPCRLPRPARGQAGRARSCAKAAARPGRMRHCRRAKVKLTHPDRLYWPDAGVTKQGLADYYSRGLAEDGALRRAAAAGAGALPRRLRAASAFSRSTPGRDTMPKSSPSPIRSTNRAKPILAIDGLEGLIGLVQGGCAGDPSLAGLAGRSRKARPDHHWTSTPGEGVPLGAGDRGARTRCASGWRQPGSPPSSRPPAARACMWWPAEARRPTGTRSRTSPRRSPMPWRPTIPTATSPR